MSRAGVEPQLYPVTQPVVCVTYLSSLAFISRSFAFLVSNFYNLEYKERFQFEPTKVEEERCLICGLRRLTTITYTTRVR
jgi:hypothetical protein